jgi:DNA-directed RNA polymerase specialized sigma24 family protein
MLSALKILSLPEKEGFIFIWGVIENMKNDGGKYLSEEQWSDLSVASLDTFLPSILTDKKWVYSIQEYILSKFENRLRTERRHKEIIEPLYLKNKETGEVYEREDMAMPDPQENRYRIEETFEKAGLSVRQSTIYSFKVCTGLTEDRIADIMKVSRSTVTKEYREAIRKIQPFRKQD